ncbi:unnamed protein product [Symbiodinium natans]|uniref:Uncharacterized protein n=1 Tax=Symbiodinium natans TaxID=878477 RepID=A0A812KE97_9DINO|nr:unnamed protein product [Symbiodinium natans]
MALAVKQEICFCKVASKTWLRLSIHLITSPLSSLHVPSPTSFKELDRVQAEADGNQAELAELRRRWAAEQPEREARPRPSPSPLGAPLESFADLTILNLQQARALLRETGEAERRFAEQERRCAEALARASDSGEEPSNGGRGSDMAAKTTRVASLEASRQQLSVGLQELQDAVRQETTLVAQLQSRCEVLRREAKALSSGAAAAREAESRAWRKMAALQATEAAARQREQSLERHGRDLQDQVRVLRAQLAASAIPPVSGLTQVTGRMEENAWDLVRKLESKVERLREDLRTKREELERLREPAEPAAEANKEAAEQNAVAQ